MKKALLSIIAIAIAHTSFAQWTSSGNNIFYNSGNVGIGTTTDLNAPLTIQGGGTTTGIANIATTLTTKFNTANPPITLGVGYVSSDNPFLQAFNSVTSTANNLILNPFGGYVGVGTIAPRAQFNIVSGTDNSGTYFPATNAVIVGADNTLSSLSSNLAISSNSIAGIGVGASIGLGGRWLGTGDSRDIEFATIKGAKENNSAGDGSGYLVFGTYGNGGMLEKVRITSSGYVGIGTPTPHEALSVNGNIRSQQIKVEIANWPDFVFKPQYVLPTLLEVKSYIDKNQHLPDMPSEQEVKENGLNLGEINKILTKKVEELTLYLIDKDKQLTEQQKQINELKEQVNAIIQNNKQR